MGNKLAYSPVNTECKKCGKFFIANFYRPQYICNKCKDKWKRTKFIINVLKKFVKGEF